MTEFKVGDVVKFVSGSPLMTVICTVPIKEPDHPKLTVFCRWFSEVAADFKYTEFLPECLRKVEQAP